MINDMKKGLMLFTLFGLVTLNATYAQTSVGGFLGYGSDVGQAGIGAIAEFKFDENWAISPGMLVYFPEYSSNNRFNWFELNVNANYYFFNQGAVNLYGLGGLNFLQFKRKERFGDERTFQHGEAGLNLGIGANFDVGKKFKPFAELKFVIGEADQLALFFGLKYSL